jgi:PhnB protein
MADVRLDVYLFFDGNCREAMDFYKGVFGGDLNVQTYSEAPQMPSEHGGKEDMADKVMHASLEGGAVKIMASDSPFPDKLGSGSVSLSLGGTDATKLTELFNALAEGGKVNQPLQKQFWGDTFGMATDKYGFDWMVNITAPKEA